MSILDNVYESNNNAPYTYPNAVPTQSHCEHTGNVKKMMIAPNVANMTERVEYILKRRAILPCRDPDPNAADDGGMQ